MNIGLVLSGGMAKGALQIGALKALNEYIPREEIKFISCASIGVLNGYAYLMNRLDEAEEMWRSACSDDTRQFISQILRSSLLQKDIKELYKQGDEVDKDFYVTLLDMKHESIVYKNMKGVRSGHLPQYLKASVAMPLYNKAVKVGNISYYDGAMVDNIPVYPLMAHDLDYVVCIYFDEHNYRFENTEFDNRALQITFPVENVLKQSMVFYQDSIENMLEKGYNHTKYLLNAMLGDRYDDLDYVYQSIQYRKAEMKDSKLRISGDMIVTNINKVAQKLARRKIVV